MTFGQKTGQKKPNCNGDIAEKTKAIKEVIEMSENLKETKNQKSCSTLQTHKIPDDVIIIGGIVQEEYDT